MALTPPQVGFVADSSTAARQLLALEGLLDQLNVLWAGSPDYAHTITQPALDATPGMNGLTVQTLADTEFVLAGILTNLKNALPALTVMARI